MGFTAKGYWAPTAFSAGITGRVGYGVLPKGWLLALQNGLPFLDTLRKVGQKSVVKASASLLQLYSSRQMRQAGLMLH